VTDDELLVRQRALQAEADELLVRQRALQAEADELLASFGLLPALTAIGRPVRTGSAALGLMVWRDLDVTVVCGRLDAEAVAALGHRLALHPDVREVTYRDDTGDHNADPTAYPDGLYLGVKANRPEWRIDLWFVDEPDRQPDLNHLATLAPRITDEVRLAILRVKDAWNGRPGYSSYDVYRAVLDHGVQNPEQYQAFLEARGD
jgi:hypothetical protein